MYRDIATMDQGPGYLNGILSLILNTTQPASRYSEEEQRAVPYFHRSRAAELLALLDSKFPQSTERPALHAQLLDYYATSGESDAVIQGGRDFLASFPEASERTTIALLMADAYARKGDTKSEFAIYDSVLQELASKHRTFHSDRMKKLETPPITTSIRTRASEMNVPESEAGEGDEAGTGNKTRLHAIAQASRSAMTAGPTQSTVARSPEYARVLERHPRLRVPMLEHSRVLGERATVDWVGPGVVITRNDSLARCLVRCCVPANPLRRPHQFPIRSTFIPLSSL